MNKLLFIFLLVSSIQPPDDYPLKDGRPTSKGIEQYIEENAEAIIAEYQDFIGDTLYNIYIYAEDLTYYNVHDSTELGRYYANEIYVSTAELFLAYELASLSEAERTTIFESNKFVKATVVHELTHDYIEQVGIEMRSIDSLRIDHAYQTNLWLIRSTENFGSTFIEEGICEYVAEKMGELIPPRVPYIPKSIEELTDKNNIYPASYKYSAYFLKDFLNDTGLKHGIKILMHNPPPSLEEILNPDLFFSRLEPLN